MKILGEKGTLLAGKLLVVSVQRLGLWLCVMCCCHLECIQAIRTDFANPIRYLPMGQSRMHSEQPPEAFRNELQANLFMAYSSPSCGIVKAPAGQFSTQMPQLSHSIVISAFVGSSIASVKQQESLTRGPKSRVISRLCQPILPNSAA